MELVTEVLINLIQNWDVTALETIREYQALFLLVYH